MPALMIIQSAVLLRSAALELLVSHNVTGLPVVDSENRVVGVVSDYDMMALEGVAEAQVRPCDLMPY